MGRFEELCKTLGYKDSGFRFGTPIESFLSDNPGVFEGILDFIREYMSPEWAENLKAEIPEKEGEGEGEEGETPEGETK
jgi:hypothetical protein